MTPEERYEKVQQQLEFLADQQAQFFASIQAHQLEIQRHSDQIAHHSEQISDLGRFLTSTARLMEQLALEAAERQQHIDERFKETGERLDALINMFERRLAEGNRHRNDDPGLQ